MAVLSCLLTAVHYAAGAGSAGQTRSPETARRATPITMRRHAPTSDVTWDVPRRNAKGSDLNDAEVQLQVGVGEDARDTHATRLFTV